MKECFMGLFLGLLALGSFEVIALGDPVAGKEKSKACVTCHGLDGNSDIGQWPKIAGQYPGYLVEQLKEFKKGAAGLRENPAMVPFVANLSEQDMEDLAAFYEAQTQTLGEAVGGPSLALGKQIYEGGIPSQGVPACSSCHGPSGHGNKLANWPRVSGQYPEYLKAQLVAYKNGNRRNGPGMMDAIAKRMNDEQMDAVANYMYGMRDKTKDK
jgi:cytochrome c553